VEYPVAMVRLPTACQQGNPVGHGNGLIKMVAAAAGRWWWFQRYHARSNVAIDPITQIVVICFMSEGVHGHKPIRPQGSNLDEGILLDRVIDCARGRPTTRRADGVHAMP